MSEAMRHVVLTVDLLGDTFIGGEVMHARVQLSNHGTAACRVPNPSNANNWEPSYVVLDSSNAVVATFDLRRGVHGSAVPQLEAHEAVLLTLEPGEPWQEVLPLEAAVAHLQSGHYKMLAILDWDGVQIQSAPVEFEFEPLQLVGAAHGLWGDPRASSIFAVWLHRRGAEQVVFEAYFRIGAGADAVPLRSDPVRVATTSELELELLSQDTVHSLGERLFHFVYGRTPAAAVVWDSLTREATQVPVHGVPIGRPFLGRDGVADVWLRHEGRATLLRWTGPHGTGEVSAQQVESCALPAGATTVAYDAERRAHHLVVIAVDGGALTVHRCLANRNGDELSRAEDRVQIGDELLQLLPDAPPNAVVDGANLHVGVVLRAVSDPQRVYLVDLRISGGTVAAQTRLVEAQHPVSAARVEHFIDASGRRPVAVACALWPEQGPVVVVDRQGRRELADSGRFDARVLVHVERRTYLLATTRLGPTLVQT